jgi:hypothetical protein
MDIPKNALKVYKQLSIHEKINAHSWRYVITPKESVSFQDTIMIGIEWYYRKKMQGFELLCFDYRNHPVLFSKPHTLTK